MEAPSNLLFSVGYLRTDSLLINTKIDEILCLLLKIDNHGKRGLTDLKINAFFISILVAKFKTRVNTEEIYSVSGKRD